MNWPKDVPVPQERPELQLSEEDGNVLSIIGRARRSAKRAGWSTQQVEAFSSLCMSGDYDNALQACMTYFEVA